MKLSILVSVTLIAGLPISRAGSEQSVPVPVSPAPSISGSQPESGAGAYQQRLYGPGTSLIAPEKAQQVVESFKASYEKLGKPRVLFYVNRELVDVRGGLKLTGRTEKTETVSAERKNSFERNGDAKVEGTTHPQTQINVAVGGGSAGTGSHETVPGKGASESRQTTVTGENTYSAGTDTDSSLSDRLTTREIETLFGRPFRAAGATLADQRVASSLIADRPIDHFTTSTNESARKDREALGKITDVVIEVLVSSRNVTVPGVSGDRTVTVPDVQATAIRLSDSAILGQASATDVLGKDRYAGRIISQFDAREITEATALALMEDIALAGR